MGVMLLNTAIPIYVDYKMFSHILPHLIFTTLKWGWFGRCYFRGNRFIEGQ